MSRSFLLCLLALCFILSSCARFTLDTSSCSMTGVGVQNYPTEKTVPFEIRESIYMPQAPFQSQVVDLETLFKDHGINCHDVLSIEMSFEADSWDALRSLFPATSRKTLVVKGLRMDR